MLGSLRTVWDPAAACSTTVVPLPTSQRTPCLQSTTSKPDGVTSDLQQLFLSEYGHALPANHFLSQEVHSGLCGDGSRSSQIDLVLVKEG
jgi:hypothetical protein